MPKVKTLYDPTVPEELKDTLHWFGRIIERPIDRESRMIPVSPSGYSMKKEAIKYIAPSPTLKPHERIELYNQQYWWRLLGILHDVYPFLTRLFGYVDFNETIGFPYICRYRPEHWSLSFLGSNLPKFLKETYKGSDRKLVIDAAIIDDAYNEAFLVKEMPPLTLPALANRKIRTSVLDIKLYLQPHVHLFDLPYNLFKFREEFIKPESGDHWLDHPFPEMDSDRRYQFVFFRNQFNNLAWKEITVGEYKLLSLFKKKGCSSTEACSWLEEQSKPWVDEAASNLQQWFQEWVLRGWLTTERPPLKRGVGN